MTLAVSAVVTIVPFTAGTVNTSFPSGPNTGFDGTVYDYHQQNYLFPRIEKVLEEARILGSYVIVFTANENHEKIRDPNIRPRPEANIRIGKKKFLKLSK